MGSCSSPIIWNGLVILQCDTQADSFVLALDASTGKTVWKTARRVAVMGHTDSGHDGGGIRAGCQRVELHSRLRPAHRERALATGRISKITAPTPIFADGLFVVASGRAPERPIFAVKPGARGDLTLRERKDEQRSDRLEPHGTRLLHADAAYLQGFLYVLANNGCFDAYDLKTGTEIYRQRLPLVGSGFSASPVAADGKIYLSNEDGDMLVVRAGSKFEHIATNSIGELLMATPALSEGVMFVRGASSVFAIANGSVRVRLLTGGLLVSPARGASSVKPLKSIPYRSSVALLC